MKNKNLNKHKSLKMAATALMSAIVLTVSATPAFAHALPSNVENENSFIETIDISNLDVSEGDIIIIDEHGIAHDGDIDPRIIPCNHSYTAIQLSRHKKNSDGSCTTTYYSGKRCSKCALIIMGDEIGTVTYVTCPH